MVTDFNKVILVDNGISKYAEVGSLLAGVLHADKTEIVRVSVMILYMIFIIYLMVTSSSELVG